MSVVVGNARWLLLVPFLVVGACAGKQDAAAAGQDCYRDQDCQSGLVCVANPQNRVCTKDVTSLASSVEGPPPEEVPVEEVPVEEDAGTTPVDEDAGAPPEELPDGG